MSYNIDHVEATLKNASIQAVKVLALLEEFQDQIPEGNFLDNLRKPASKAVLAGDLKKAIPLTNCDWYGEGSGHAFEECFVKHLAQHIDGKVEAFCTWEGGDSTSAFIVENGVYEDCDVEIKVKRKTKPKGKKA